MNSAAAHRRPGVNVRRVDPCVIFEGPIFGSYAERRGILIENCNITYSLYMNTEIIHSYNSQQPISNTISTSATVVTLLLDNKSCAV